MKIIIPMTGIGKRFIDAGYTTPKPLIEVDGKPIIEHVVSLFPNEKDYGVPRERIKDNILKVTTTKTGKEGISEYSVTNTGIHPRDEKFTKNLSD